LRRQKILIRKYNPQDRLFHQHIDCSEKHKTNVGNKNYKEDHCDKLTFFVKQVLDQMISDDEEIEIN